MSKTITFNFDLFKALLRSKFVNIRTTMGNKFINLSIWAVCSLFVTGYLMQAFGLTADYGPFQLGGILASVGLFELYGNAVTVVSDIEGDRAISYYLSLPGSALTVLLSYVCYYATIGIGMSILLIPLGKLFLMNQFVLGNVSWLSLLFFIVLANVICATTTLLLSALIPGMDKFDILWTRFIFPLWFLGGFQFSWATVHARLPWFSYILIANPMTYVTEGMRAALLGQEGNINFWICCAVLIVLWIPIIYFAHKILKRRLDFV